MIDALTSAFGLTRMPFGRDLPPSRLHRHRDCSEAAARITWAVGSRTICVITGEAGSGKTAAVRTAVADLDPAAHTLVYIGNPTAGVRGILSAVVTALGGRPADGTTFFTHRELLGNASLACPARTDVRPRPRE